VVKVLLATSCVAACAWLGVWAADTSQGADRPSRVGHARLPGEVAPYREVTFVGMCDASGAVPLSDHTFAVADDEDNVLRVYDADRGGAPLYAADISRELQIPARKRHNKPDKPPREADIEAATRQGDLAFWITSHGLDKRGKLRPERFRFFATTLPDDQHFVRVVGEPFHDLIAHIVEDPRFARFDLARAARAPVGSPEGLNVEGMTARPEGSVMIGLRSPTPGGRALIIVLENPENVAQGEAPRFGEPLTLDLGGLGIRGLSQWRGRYLIIAGSYAQDGESRLYAWQGGRDVPAVVPLGLAELNPEGFFTPEGRDQIMLLSDDGATLHDGERCKDLEESGLKRFRGRWHALPWS